MADVKLFLSCVSDEFAAYRESLRHALTRPNVEIKIPEDFQALGGDTLAMLEDYIERCDVVVHFVGAMAGSTPQPTSVDDLLKRRSELAARLADKGLTREALGALTYTQWEAWLAVGFNQNGLRKNLVIVTPADGVQGGERFKPTAASRASQAEHLRRLRAADLYPAKPFASADDLAKQVLASAVLDALIAAGTPPKTKPRNLPLLSLGPLFAGREQALEDLRQALVAAKGGVVALHGLGGIGKTRLAIEYGWAGEADHSALLFVGASDGASLNAGLAALAGPDILDLPEKDARDDATKIAAAFRWLEANPTWLMILDSVDDGPAVAAVSQFLPRLKGGHVIVTARAAKFPPAIRKLELNALDEESATRFLLERTEDDRRKAPDDAALARRLAGDLGGLALGLEQAGAHIATEGIGFARYLALWEGARDAALTWSDPVVTGSDKTLATVWTTSVARLSAESRRLLDRLAFLAPDPIPDSLFDIAVSDESGSAGLTSARAGLHAYSLLARATQESGASAFVIHRLVQDFARRAMGEERRTQALREALEWVNAAFVGDPHDVRSWPILDPLVPHALAVARHADAAEIAEPTAKLLTDSALLLYAKARYKAAEPLFRRALALYETIVGPAHPFVANRLNNLAELLKSTNRLDEAEPLYRRALAIDLVRYGPNHPSVGGDLNNLAGLFLETNRLDAAEELLRDSLKITEAVFGPSHQKVAERLENLGSVLLRMNRLAEAEPLYRRALEISEASYEPDHPRVATSLDNLGVLLKETNRLAEAELLTRRALAIFEKRLGLSHPQVGNCIQNLAAILATNGNLAEAEPLMRRALAIFERSFGPDHPKVAMCLQNLTILLRDSERPGEAEPLMRRILAIDEKGLGPGHPNVATDLSDLAILLHIANRLAEAEPLMRRSLAICEASLGPDHPNTRIVRDNLAALEADRGRAGG